jgi:transposase
VINNITIHALLAAFADSKAIVEGPRIFRTRNPLRFFPEERLSMSKQRRSFTPEYKEQVARMVVEESRAIPSTAREIGVNEQTLRNWVNAYRVNHAGEEPPLTISERARLRELEKENRELRLEREFLGKAAAFFASEYR